MGETSGHSAQRVQTARLQFLQAHARYLFGGYLRHDAFSQLLGGNEYISEQHPSVNAEHRRDEKVMVVMTTDHSDETRKSDGRHEGHRRERYARQGQGASVQHPGAQARDKKPRPGICLLKKVERQRRPAQAERESV
jgi:hypothetical protein